MSEIDWSEAPEWADRVVRSPRKLKMFWANDDERQTLDGSRYGVNTQHVRDNWEVVERRPAFVPCKPLVTFSHPCNAEPVLITIEQRIASLRALKKRVEETRAELTRDLEELGLTWMVRDEPTITDWRDLRVGDVIECVGNWEGENTNGKQFSVTKLEPIHSSNKKPIQIIIDGVTCPETWGGTFRFIRRP